MRKVLLVMVVSCAMIGGWTTSASAASRDKLLAQLDLITEDLDAIGADADAIDLDAMVYDCQQLNRHANMLLAMSRPRQVNKQAWRSLRRGVQHYATAGGFCARGAAALDEELIASSIEEIQAGGEDITLSTRLLS